MSFGRGLDSQNEIGTHAVPNDYRLRLLRLRKALNMGTILTMQTLYPYISEEQTLSEPSKIPDIIGDDTVFLILYSQLYYRQIHNSTLTEPTLKQRILSYQNYQAFFHYLLQGDEYLRLKIPDQWLWELMNEFVNQFESFSRYRENLKNKTTNEIKTLKNFEYVWNPLHVIKSLQSLVDKAVNQIETKTFFLSSLLYKKVGYFAVCCLVRVQTLLADYHQAIKLLDERRTFPTIISKVLFSRLAGCQFSVAYYTSFSYMMMQRYGDAINIITNTLRLFQDNNRIYKNPGWQNKQIRKHTQKMLYLLCMSFALKTNINSNIRCKIINSEILKVFAANECQEKLRRLEQEMDRGKEYIKFKFWFEKASPRFMLPTPPSLDSELEDFSEEVSEYQLKIFLNEVKLHSFLPSLKHEMKIVLIEKIGKMPLFTFTMNFVMQKQHRESNNFRHFWERRSKKVVIKDVIQLLMRLQNKTTHLVREKNPMLSSLSGSFEMATGVQFYLSHDEEEAITCVKCGFCDEHK